jgi:hypothetical protein
MVRPSWVQFDRAPALGYFVERTLYELEPARLEGFEPTTPGSEVCQETCWGVFCHFTPRSRFVLNVPSAVGLLSGVG